MLNNIDIMGRLTRAPELRRTNSGVAVTSFTLAVERDYADKTTGQKEVDFLDCTAWRGTAEFIDKYFGKGDMMAVNGRLQIRAYTDKEGNNRKAAEIQVNNVYFAARNNSPKAAAGYEVQFTEITEDDDGLPY